MTEILDYHYYSQHNYGKTVSDTTRSAITPPAQKVTNMITRIHTSNMTTQIHNSSNLTTRDERKNDRFKQT